MRSLLPQRTLCSARTHAKATSMLNMFRKMTSAAIYGTGGLVILDEVILDNHLKRQIRKWQCDDMRRSSLRSHACDATYMEDVIMSGKLEKPGPLMSLWLPKETLVKRRCNARNAVDSVRKELAQQSWGAVAVLEEDVMVCSYLFDDPATCLVLWIRGIDSSGFHWNHRQIARDCATTHLKAQEQ